MEIIQDLPLEVETSAAHASAATVFSSVKPSEHHGTDQLSTLSQQQQGCNSNQTSVSASISDVHDAYNANSFECEDHCNVKGEICLTDDAVTPHDSLPNLSHYLPPVNEMTTMNELNSATLPSFTSQVSEIFSSNIPFQSTDRLSSGNTEVPVQLSKISTAWKESSDDNNDIFNDDYFKINMPGLYCKESNGNDNSRQQTTSDLNLNLNSCRNDSDFTAASSIHEPSFLSVPTANPNVAGRSNLLRDSSRNSLTRKVDEYFDKRNPLRPTLSSNSGRGVVNFSRSVSAKNLYA